MKKALFIFGTRPEAIKMAPIINKFKKDKNNFRTLVAVTAQHREMLDQVLSLFKIIPDYDLNIMKPNQSLEDLTSRILIKVSALLNQIRPDILFVQGDTTTTYASALASFYKKIPIAHIEAGLRTKNIHSPFPEEVNRRMTTITSSYHFPPTEKSKNNLLNEGVSKKNITISGNTVIDALMYISKKIDLKRERIENYFFKNFSILFDNKKTILITGHRRENFGEGFENICQSVKEIAKKKDVQIIYPVHLNPNVQEPVYRILKEIDNIYLIPPQNYEPFIFLMKKSYIILTDSGGIQEEAPSLGKPVLVLRDTTERPEGIDAGTAKLVGTDKNNIISNLEVLLENSNEYDKMSKAVNPYGLGNASEKIHEFVKKNIIN